MSALTKSAPELESWPEEPENSILKDLVDVHAHPTDYKRFSEDGSYRSATGNLNLAKLCAMSSHLQDQDLVKQLATEHPGRILPAFGLHPWWSHHISFNDPEEVKGLDKKAHYTALFPKLFDAASEGLSSGADALLASFPNPTSFSDYCRKTLIPYLEQFPNAMLGEVGLDRSFRIPVPSTDPKTDREVHKAAKQFTELKTPIEHQLELLKKQMDIAFQLNRNVSMHSVQAQGHTVDLVLGLPKTSKYWKDSQSKICMHSYGGSADTVARLCRLDKARIYFSFSTTINARLARLQDLVRAVPDNRLLVESDYNDIRCSEERIWEILGVVCHAKRWGKGKAVSILKENWSSFNGERDHV